MNVIQMELGIDWPTGHASGLQAISTSYFPIFPTRAARVNAAGQIPTSTRCIITDILPVPAAQHKWMRMQIAFRQDHRHRRDLPRLRTLPAEQHSPGSRLGPRPQSLFFLCRPTCRRVLERPSSRSDSSAARKSRKTRNSLAVCRFATTVRSAYWRHSSVSSLSY